MPGTLQGPFDDLKLLDDFERNMGVALLLDHRGGYGFRSRGELRMDIR